jgi:GlpG protein
VREIGTLTNEQEAEIFRDHLIAQQIPAKLVQGKDGWGVWVINENLLPQAKQQLAEFQLAPNDPSYRESSRVAREIEKQKASDEKDYQKKVRRVADRWEAPAWKKYPLVFCLIMASIAIGVMTDFGATRTPTFKTLTFTTYFERLIWGDDGLVVVKVNQGVQAMKNGEVWRMITPIFLHFGIQHFFFNMMSLQFFGGRIEFNRGTLRLLILVVVAAIVPNWAEYLVDPDTIRIFGGMSGVCYALFGYVWAKGFRYPAQNLSASPTTVALMIGWFLACLTGVLGPVANVVHGVGLAVGLAFGMTRF